MKKKYVSTAMLALLLLVLFLPVFFYVIFYGTNLNYNEMHKILTVEGNKVLLLCAVIGALALGAVYYVLRKLPCTGKAVTFFICLTFAVCVLFYAINVNISKSIAFYGGWDCGMVANSARWLYEGGDLRSTAITFPSHGFYISCILFLPVSADIPTIRNLSGSSSSASCCHWRYSVRYFWSFRSAGTLEFP